MKIGGNDAFVFQADVSRSNFSENKPLTTRHLRHLIKRWAEFGESEK